MMDLKRKAKVVQRSSRLPDYRMTESGWLTFNHFNSDNPTKRMDDTDVLGLLLNNRQAGQQTVRDLVLVFAMKR